MLAQDIFVLQPKEDFLFIYFFKVQPVDPPAEIFVS